MIRLTRRSPSAGRFTGLSLCTLVTLTVIPACSTRAQPDREGPASGGGVPISRESREKLEAVVGDPRRPEEDRARDGDRRPAEVLAFFGIEEGMRVADLQCGTGYYTELLSGVVGERGRVYAQNNDFVVKRFADGPLNQRLGRLREAGRDNVERIDAELDELDLPAGLDAVLFIRFYHDLFWLPTPDGDKADRREFLRRVYASLKPGGVFGVVDHHAEAGSGDRDALDPREGLHRIDVEWVKREVREAGFELAGESDALANPGDTRDWNIFSEDRRDKTDRFVLRFVKPRS